MWLQHCSSYHGEGGAGDGPVSKGKTRFLRILRRRASPRACTMTISSGGFQRGKDSSMPAYKETLEEEEIWKIVDFLRSLEQDG